MKWPPPIFLFLVYPSMMFIGTLNQICEKDFFDKSEIEKRPGLKFDYPGKRFSSARGVDWDMDEKDISRLMDTLAYASLFISYASSIVIDAAIFGKPAINIGGVGNKKRS